MVIVVTLQKTTREREREREREEKSSAVFGENFKPYITVAHEKSQK